MRKKRRKPFFLLAQNVNVKGKDAKIIYKIFFMCYTYSK